MKDRVRKTTRFLTTVLLVVFAAVFQGCATPVYEPLTLPSTPDFEPPDPPALETPTAPAIESLRAPVPSSSASPPRINTNQIPFSSDKGLLPHNGLFVRRHNSFGSQLSVGIRELIDEGVMIDQKRIRFDDFVAVQADEIADPDPGKALEVSFGISEIPSNMKRDIRSSHFLEVAIKAAERGRATTLSVSKPLVNYVLVIDASGSMDGMKLDAVKSSIRNLFEMMEPDDVIGIVQFDDKPSTVMKATRVREVTKEDLASFIASVEASGGTDINAGLSFGIDEISRFGRMDSINRVFLFSDGNPTSGITDWASIRSNIAGRLREDFKLAIFAFGTDANTRELERLAGTTGGQYSHVISVGDIDYSLENEIARREYLVASNVQLRFILEETLGIVHFYGHDLVSDPVTRTRILSEVARVGKSTRQEFGIEPLKDIVTDEEGIRLFVPDLATNEVYWIVFELLLPPDHAKEVGEMELQYFDLVQLDNRHETHALAVGDGVIPLDTVLEHALNLRSSEVIFYALDDLYIDGIDTAKQRIEQHCAILESANATLNSDRIRGDRVSLMKFVSLADNLGTLRVFSDDPAGSYVKVMLNSYGRARNGYLRIDK